MSQLLTNYYEAASVILFGIGFMNLLLQRNLIKKFIGLNIMDTATYLFLAAKGYVAGRTAPILTNGIIDADYYINPIPAGLVLTGIYLLFQDEIIAMFGGTVNEETCSGSAAV